MASAEFAALPFDDDFVNARVGGPRFRKTAIDRRLLALGLKFFLEIALGIGFRSVIFTAECRQRGLEQTQNDRARAFPARLGIDRAKDRLDRIGQNGTALPALAVFLAAPENEMFPQAEFLGHALEVMPVHESCPQHGQPALGQLREAAIELRGDGQLQHRIAEKFEPLVVRKPLPLFMTEGCVSQRLTQQVAIGKRMAETFLKLFETRTHTKGGQEDLSTFHWNLTWRMPEWLVLLSVGRHLARRTFPMKPLPPFTRTLPFHAWHDVDPGVPSAFTAVVEIPLGSSNKYELDKVSGLLKLDRVLHSAVFYPANYGFIPQTMADDGDPMDVLILSSEPVYPLTLITARPIGVMTMVDQDELDYKVIAVGISDPEYNTYHDVHELPRHRLAVIRRFFEDYKTLENKRVVVDDILPALDAVPVIEKSLAVYREWAATAKK